MHNQLHNNMCTITLIRLYNIIKGQRNDTISETCFFYEQRKCFKIVLITYACNIYNFSSSVSRIELKYTILVVYIIVVVVFHDYCAETQDLFIKMKFPLIYYTMQYYYYRLELNTSRVYIITMSPVHNNIEIKIVISKTIGFMCQQYNICYQ